MCDEPRTQLAAADVVALSHIAAEEAAGWSNIVTISVKRPINSTTVIVSDIVARRASSHARSSRVGAIVALKTRRHREIANDAAARALAPEDLPEVL